MAKTTHAHARLTGWMSLHSRSQADLARALRVSTATVSRIVAGDRTPGLALALRIADLTGIQPAAWTKKPTSKAVA